MKYLIIALLSAAVGIYAYRSFFHQSTDTEAEKRAIAGLMFEQQEAWNRASVDDFMKHYWHSDSLLFIGSSGIKRGWQATLDNYKKHYPDAAAMGRLQFTNEVIDVLAPDRAFVIGRWQLFRQADTLGGHYTLLWKKLEKQWVIVADHSS